MNKISEQSCSVMKSARAGGEIKQTIAKSELDIPQTVQIIATKMGGKSSSSWAREARATRASSHSFARLEDPKGISRTFAPCAFPLDPFESPEPGVPLRSPDKAKEARNPFRFPRGQPLGTSVLPSQGPDANKNNGNTSLI